MISYVIFMSKMSPYVPRVHIRVEDICTNLCLLKINIHVNSWLEVQGISCTSKTCYIMQEYS